MSQRPHKRGFGFRQTGSLVTAQVRRASEARGFAETRLLTDWQAICGPELAGKVTPVRVTYAKGGFGATLVVLCEGARAPEISMQKDVIRQRVNACYGYNAIARVQITQTAPGMGPTGFAEDAPHFEVKAPDPKIGRRAAEAVTPIADQGLKDALKRLGENVLSRQPHGPKRKDPA